MSRPLLIYILCAATLLGVVLRPWKSQEAWWAIAGASALVVLGLVPPALALTAIGKGTDVYLFLVGMMVLSALAEREGLFDHLAARCVRQARGSASRLFLLVYGVGTLVTVLMSNDATAVVLTPAVLAVCRKARARPLPYLLACALIANAASFVLPISNPANLVVFGDQLPSLGAWLARFAVPSLFSVVVTYSVLRLRSRSELAEAIEVEVEVPTLSRSGRLAAAGVALTAVVLLCASAFGAALGMPTLAAAAVAFIAIALAKRESPWRVLQHVSWSVLPLVAGLFVVVEALRQAGLLRLLTAALESASTDFPVAGGLAAGALVAFACNLMNNLPAGLIAGSVVTSAGVDPLVQAAVAIGVDLGPNLSVTGSLATILWLVALRRQDVQVSGWTFLRTGAVAMPLALGAALAGLWLQHALGG